VTAAAARLARLAGLAGVSTLVVLPCPAPAAEPGLLDRGVFLAVGTFAQDSDVEIGLDGQTGSGDRVDLDRTFGGNDATRLRLEGSWRFAERHKLRAMWFDANVSQQRTIAQDIEWGDEVFPAGTVVSLERDFSIYELAYEYAFVRRETLELAGTLGLHYARFEVSLAAALDDPDNPGSTRRVDEEGRLKAPLPVVGVHALWNPGGRFWLDAGAQLFALSFDQVDGNLVNYRVAAIWQPRPWLGLGIGYDACTVDVDVAKERFDGSLDWTYDGPQLFFSAAF
jgi:hypothetical protein